MDLAGYVLEKDLGFIHVCYPMEYETTRHNKTAWFEDTRTEEKEILWKGMTKKTAITRR